MVLVIVLFYSFFCFGSGYFVSRGKIVLIAILPLRAVVLYLFMLLPIKHFDVYQLGLGFLENQQLE